MAKRLSRIEAFLQKMPGLASTISEELSSRSLPTPLSLGQSAQTLDDLQLTMATSPTTSSPHLPSRLLPSTAHNVQNKAQPSASLTAPGCLSEHGPQYSDTSFLKDHQSLFQASNEDRTITGPQPAISHTSAANLSLSPNNEGSATPTAFYSHDIPASIEDSPEELQEASCISSGELVS